MHELCPAFRHHVHAALKVNAYFQVIFVVACVMHGELSVTEIHAVKTLNSELRSNSQLSACILYGRKNDLTREVISAPVRG